MVKFVKWSNLRYKDDVGDGWRVLILFDPAMHFDTSMFLLLGDILYTSMVE